MRPPHPAVLAAVAWLLWSTISVQAIKWAQFESGARGYPVMLDRATGRRVGDGTFVQWIADGKLHVAITYSGKSRRIEERVVLSQRPELIQDSWAFTESRAGKPYRRFEVDLRSGHAIAQTWTEDGPKRREDELKVTPGHAFAGFGFTLAVKALRPRLIRGEHATLEAVGFSPKPRSVDVDISYAGRDRVRMAGRAIDGDRFIVHAKIPALARLLVHVPDATIWLTPPPAGFLRWEGPLAEPDDPIVRVDLLPG